MQQGWAGKLQKLLENANGDIRLRNSEMQRGVHRNYILRRTFIQYQFVFAFFEMHYCILYNHDGGKLSGYFWPNEAA